MIEIKINKTPYMLPTGFHELSYAKYLRMLEAKNPIQTFAAMLGCPADVLDGAELTMEQEKLIYASLTWLNTAPVLDTITPPPTVTLGGVEYKTPQNLELKSFGQRLAAQTIIQNAQTDGVKDVEILPTLVAIYLQPLVHGGRFDNTRIEEVTPLVLDASFDQVYNLGAFFLRKYYGLPSGGLNYLKQYLAMKQKKRSGKWRAVWNWIRNLVRGGGRSRGVV